MVGGRLGARIDEIGAAVASISFAGAALAFVFEHGPPSYVSACLAVGFGALAGWWAFQWRLERMVRTLELEAAPALREDLGVSR